MYKVCHDIKSTSWHYKVLKLKVCHAVKYYFMTSKSISWRQIICHDIEKYIMTSNNMPWHWKVRHDIKYYGMTLKSMPWHKIICNDIKTYTWCQSVHRDIKVMSWCPNEWHQNYGMTKYIMISQSMPGLQKYVMLSWRQRYVRNYVKVCPANKLYFMTSKGMSWHKNVHHDVKKYIMTSKAIKVTSWCQQYFMMLNS